MKSKINETFAGLFSGGEDRGVSPVIGVILMVAITVILAAVIGAFVLGLGEDLGNANGAPTASVGSSENPEGGAVDGAIVLTHNGGDSMDAANLYVTVAGERLNVANDDASAIDGLSEIKYSGGSFGASSTITLQFEDASGSATSTSPTVASGDTVGLAFDDGSNSVNLVIHTAGGDFGEVTA